MWPPEAQEKAIWPEGSPICGIVGIAGGKLTRVGVGIFEDLMIVSNLRGRWGAGACVVTNKKIMSYKTEWSGVDVLDMKGYRENINGKDNVTTLLGHTRHPTKGGQTVNESHPHVFKKVTGVHNGTLDKVDGRHVLPDQSDSRLFYEHVNREGFSRAIAYAQGAYCFVWIDHENETLNFIRNNQRPMTIAKVRWGTESQTIVWASEKEFLELVFKRRNIYNVDYIELPTSEVWSIPLGFKKGDDFEVTKSVYGGSGYWQPVVRPGHSQSKGDSSWSAGFQTKSASTSSGKKAYVWKDGEFVEKSSILNPPAQKVSLPRPQDKDELEGKKEVRLPDGKDTQGGVSDKQRSAAPTKVSLGSNAASFLKNLTGGIRKEEAEFYEDNVVDLFQKPDVGPNYEQDNETEEAFAALLAQKDAEAGEGVLWEDCQFEDGSVPIVEASKTSEMVETMRGHYIPREDYLKILQNGCIWTGEAAGPSDVIHWVDIENFILDHVTTDPEAMADLSQVYPTHPKLQDWLHALKPKKRQGKDITPHHVTIH